MCHKPITLPTYLPYVFFPWSLLSCVISKFDSFTLVSFMSLPLNNLSREIPPYAVLHEFIVLPQKKGDPSIAEFLSSFR